MTPELERTCVDRGIRLTRQRRIVLTEMERSAGHPTADDLSRRVKKRGVSQATVYRALASLTAAGVLAEIHLASGGPRRFELAGSSRHDHLLDIRSGELLAFQSPDIAPMLESLAAKAGFRLISYTLEVVGERL